MIGRSPAGSWLPATACPRRRATGSIALLELLRDDPYAPTSVVDPRQAVDVHVADSLSGLGIEGLAKAGTIADIGSGAGFPGLPLALALPAARIDLIESSARKCEFLERAVEAAATTNASIVNRRAELWAAEDGAGRYDAAVVRAVAGLATLVEYASPLLSTGRHAGGLEGQPRQRRGAAAAAAAAAARDEAGRGACGQARMPASRDRHLHVFEKIGPTPPGFPRRAGVAAKRPLAP